MNFKKLIDADDAVSPVIGVILMVAITVILAAVIGTFVLGQADNLGDSAPQVQFDYDVNSSGNAVATHQGGDSFDPANVNVEYDGTTTTGLSETWNGAGSAGGSHTTAEPVAPDQTARIVWSSPEGDTSSVIGSYDIPA